MRVPPTNTPTHMRPLVSSRNPGLQMHLKLPSSLIHNPLRHMFLIRHSSWSMDEQKQIDRLIAMHLGKINWLKAQIVKLTINFMNFTLSLTRDKPHFSLFHSAFNCQIVTEQVCFNKSSIVAVEQCSGKQNPISTIYKLFSKPFLGHSRTLTYLRTDRSQIITFGSYVCCQKIKYWAKTGKF